MYKLVALALIAASIAAQTTNTGTTNTGTTNTGTTNTGTTNTGTTTTGTTTTGTTTVVARTAACPNDEYCIACNGAKCTACAYSYLDANGICQVPTTKISRAVAYTNATTAAGCAEGYYLNNNACTAISVTDCAYVASTAPNVCVGCENSKLPTTAGACTGGAACTLANCDICSSNTRCLKCSSKYALTTDGTCISEPTGNCRTATGTTCTACDLGYYANSNSCKSSSIQDNVTIVSAVVALLAFMKLIA